MNWLYDNDRTLSRPWRADLSTLLHEHSFKSLFNNTLFNELNLIRKTGNVAAHGKSVSQQDALASLKYLFRFMRHWQFITANTPEPQIFDEALIPHGQATQPNAKQLAETVADVEAKNAIEREAEQRQRELAEQNTQLKQQLEQQKAFVG